MTEPEPEYTTSKQGMTLKTKGSHGTNPFPANDQPTADDKRLLDIRADLVGALVHVERLMEERGILTESAVITRRERRREKRTREAKR
jgi:hypothetical protein